MDAPSVISARCKYPVFISYSHRDERWARWLHKAIEGAIGGDMTVRYACKALAAAVLVLLGAWMAAGSTALAANDKAEITILYDAFGKTSTMQKDWGFAAFIEYRGKRILFDTGNDAEIFAHNVQAKGIDLSTLDFAIVSHRHGDHTSGLNHLTTVNPGLQIYAPKENFGVFGAALPGSFYKRDEALPPEMRYDGKPPKPCISAAHGPRATSRGSPRRPRWRPAFT
jgi:glyoxylase-like metal-dependent hydrolase (beta-lactamase superfamily II)